MILFINKLNLYFLLYIRRRCECVFVVWELFVIIENICCKMLVK